jgi:hypothetical protein
MFVCFWLFGIFDKHFVNFILKSFGTFFPVLVCFAKTNLAILPECIINAPRRKKIFFLNALGITSKEKEKQFVVLFLFYIFKLHRNAKFSDSLRM